MVAKNKLVVLALPTNEPSTAFKYLIPTLENLKDFSPYCTLAVNFQPPWTNNKISEFLSIAEKVGFECICNYKGTYSIPQKGWVPFNRIRYDAAKLVPDAFSYFLLDDDFTFEKFRPSQSDPSEFLARNLRYLIENPKCGIILNKYRRYASQVKTNRVGPANPQNSYNYVNELGILFRRIKGGLVVPDSALGLYGSDEEKLGSSWRLYNGYYAAVQTNAPIKHWENVDKDEETESGSRMYQWHHNSVLDYNTNKYIREHFYPDYINKVGVTALDVIDHSTYIDNGGITITEDLITDYSESNSIEWLSKHWRRAK